MLLPYLYTGSCISRFEAIVSNLPPTKTTSLPFHSSKNQSLGPIFATNAIKVKSIYGYHSKATTSTRGPKQCGSRYQLKKKKKKKKPDIAFPSRITSFRPSHPLFGPDLFLLLGSHAVALGHHTGHPVEAGPNSTALLHQLLVMTLGRHDRSSKAVLEP